MLAHSYKRHALTRLKFLLLSFLALGLLVASSVLSAPMIAAALVEQGAVSASHAPASVALALEARRSSLQAALLQATGPAVWNAGPKPGYRIEPPTADRLNQVRTAVGDALPEPLRASLVVGLLNEAGSLVAQGAGDAAAPTDGLDLKPLAAAQGKGAVVMAFGQPTFFVAQPLAVSDRGEVRGNGTVVVGLPLVPELEPLAKSLGLSALAVVNEGAVVAQYGAKPQLDAALKMKVGGTEVVERGAALSLGPIALPHFTASDPMGGQAVLAIASRQALPGGGVELVAVRSLAPAMVALAEGQKLSLFFIAGLLAAGLLFVALGGEREDDAPGAVIRSTAVSVPSRPPESRLDPMPPSFVPELPLADAPAQEASPDDFQFGAAPVVPSPSSPEMPSLPNDMGQEASSYEPTTPGANPYALMGSRPPVPDEELGGEKTTAYPFSKPPVGSMAMASTEQAPAFDPFNAAGGGPAQRMDLEDESATRVAAIPEELIKASARQSGEVPAVGLRGSSPSSRLPVSAPIAPMGSGGEEAHFQDVFREFVTTRERCGEPSDGLTFEKFSAKLRKNKDQLVQKYNCKTVRFQVYVKDGKAALKATPVKD